MPSTLPCHRGETSIISDFGGTRFSELDLGCRK